MLDQVNLRHVHPKLARHFRGRPLLADQTIEDLVMARLDTPFDAGECRSKEVSLPFFIPRFVEIKRVRDAINRRGLARRVSICRRGAAVPAIVCGIDPQSAIG